MDKLPVECSRYRYVSVNPTDLNHPHRHPGVRTSISAENGRFGRGPRGQTVTALNSSKSAENHETMKSKILSKFRCSGARNRFANGGGDSRG